MSNQINEKSANHEFVLDHINAIANSYQLSPQQKGALLKMYQIGFDNGVKQVELNLSKILDDLYLIKRINKQ